MLAFRSVTTRLVTVGRLGLQGLLHAPDIDQVLAVLALIALLVDPLLLHKVSHLTPVMGVLAFVTALPLVARRRFPLGVLIIVVPLVLVCLIVFHPNRAAVGIVMVLVSTVGLEGGRIPVAGGRRADGADRDGRGVHHRQKRQRPRRHRQLLAGARRPPGR